MAEVVEPATQLHAHANTHARLTHTSRRCMHCAVRADARTLQPPSLYPCRFALARALVVPRPTFRLSLPSHADSHAASHARTRIVIAVIDFPPTFGLSSVSVAARCKNGRRRLAPRVSKAGCQKGASCPTDNGKRDASRRRFLHSARFRVSMRARLFFCDYMQFYIINFCYMYIVILLYICYTS